MAVIGPEGEVTADLADVRVRFAASVQPKQLAAPAPKESGEEQAATGRKKK